MILFNLKPKTMQNNFVNLSVNCIVPLYSVFLLSQVFYVREFPFEIWSYDQK